MNVLILTPDSVGSTFLQRTLTVYMQMCDFDRPVINLHELTNGLIKYFSSDFNQEILGKKDGSWGYHQSLSEIVHLLDSVNHYKTSRLAQYHIKRRQDNFDDQMSFYDYLNENFYIISCRRQNVFEHALSRTLAKVTGKLNVYTPHEKIDTFLDLYKNKIKLDQDSLLKSLQDYADYISWCDHFEIASYFHYETDVANVENFVLDLPFMTNRNSKTFDETFNISFNDWNKCHYYAGDVGSIAIDNIKFLDNYDKPTTPLLNYQIVADYNNIASDSWPKVESVEQLQNLSNDIKNELLQQHNFSVEHSENKLKNYVTNDKIKFFNKNLQGYTDAMQAMNRMTDLGIMISPPPMKKQTLVEKKFMIKNFEECVVTYNCWQNSNSNIAALFDNDQLLQQNQSENNFWQLNQKLLK